MSANLNFAMLAGSLLLLIALAIWVSEYSPRERDKKAFFWWAGVVIIVGIGAALVRELLSVAGWLFAVSIGQGTAYSIIGALVAAALAWHCRFYPAYRP